MQRKTFPMDMKVDKAFRFQGHDLDGDPIGEFGFGLCKVGSRKTPYIGFYVAGRNNQRKSMVLDSLEDLDRIIAALTKFRDSSELDGVRLQNAVR